MGGEDNTSAPTPSHRLALPVPDPREGQAGEAPTKPTKAALGILSGVVGGGEVGVVH